MVTETNDNHSHNPNLIKCGYCNSEFVRINSHYKYCHPDYQKAEKAQKARKHYIDNKEEISVKEKIYRMAKKSNPPNLSDLIPCRYCHHDFTRDTSWDKYCSPECRKAMRAQRAKIHSKTPEHRNYVRLNKKKKQAYDQEYNINHYEEKIEMGRLYYKNNKEECLKKTKIYRENHIEQEKSNKKRYYQDNREVFIEKSRQRHVINREIENKRRAEEGLPLVGEGWICQRELLFIIQDLFLDEMITYNDRATLCRLELDIYLPEFKLAFEYNGEQHYQHIPFFHETIEIFEKQVKRDIEKQAQCRELGITLITVKYDEPLTKEYILDKIIEAYNNQVVLDRSIKCQCEG